jgi:hypothetical protein
LCALPSGATFNTDLLASPHSLAATEIAAAMMGEAGSGCESSGVVSVLGAQSLEAVPVSQQQLSQTLLQPLPTCPIKVPESPTPPPPLLQSTPGAQLPSQPIEAFELLLPKLKSALHAPQPSPQVEVLEQQKPPPQSRLFTLHWPLPPPLVLLSPQGPQPPCPLPPPPSVQLTMPTQGPSHSF